VLNKLRDEAGYSLLYVLLIVFVIIAILILLGR